MTDVRMLEEQSGEESEAMNLWRSLIEHPAWKKLEVIAANQVAGRLAPRPLNSMDEVLKMQFEQGEASGIQTLLKLPELQIEQAMRNLDTIQKEINSAKSIEQYRMAGSNGGGAGDLERRANGWGASHGSGAGILNPANSPFGTESGEPGTDH